MKKIRDLSVLSINSEQYLVISCDSSGGIGNKLYDVVQIDPEIMGYYTAHVALVEFLAFGIEPIGLVDGLAVELEPTGKKIISGLNKACLEAGTKVITGSTEENIPVVQTGVGVTAFGICLKLELEKKYTKKGIIYIWCRPFVGNEVLENRDMVMTINDVKTLRSLPYVQEIIPIGSKGIKYDLEREFDFKKINLNKSIDIDLEKSSGPATCAIVLVEEDFCDIFEKDMDNKYYKIGQYNRN